MAAKQKKKSSEDFSFDVVSDDEARQELAELRSGRGGGRSKYEPLARAAEELSPGSALELTLGKHQVAALRGHLRRKFGDRYTVRSSELEEDRYRAFVFLSSDLED